MSCAAPRAAASPELLRAARVGDALPAAGAPAMPASGLATPALSASAESGGRACKRAPTLAFRFFAAGAVPLTVAPESTRANLPQMEQPGCVHASMDCRYARRGHGYLPSCSPTARGSAQGAGSRHACLPHRPVCVGDRLRWPRSLARAHRDRRRPAAVPARAGMASDVRCACAPPGSCASMRGPSWRGIARRASDSSQTHALGDLARCRGAV